MTETYTKDIYREMHNEGNTNRDTDRERENETDRQRPV